MGSRVACLALLFAAACSSSDSDSVVSTGPRTVSALPSCISFTPTTPISVPANSGPWISNFTAKATNCPRTSLWAVSASRSGSVTAITTARLSGQWTYSDRLAFTASIADQQQDYLTSSRRDNLVSLSAGVTYQIWPGIGVTTTYTHGQLYSNLPGASFTTDFISFGGSSKF